MMEMANDNRDGNRGGDGMEKAAQGWDGMGKQHPTDISSNTDTDQLYKNDGIEWQCQSEGNIEPEVVVMAASLVASRQLPCEIVAAAQSGSGC